MNHMEELKRLFNHKTVLILLVLAACSALLFYNQQVQNGNNEIRSMQTDYSETDYNIFDVNIMYMDILNEWNAFAEGKESESIGIQEFLGSYYKANISREDKSFKIYMVASEIFKNNLDYVQNYNNTIKNMRNQAVNMIHIGAFSNERSYSYLNILKTRFDLKVNENMHVEISGERAIDSIYKYNLTGMFLLIFMMYIIYKFLDERKIGLWNIIYAAKNGRINFAVQRYIILFVFSMVSSLVLNLIIYIESFWMYGGINNLLFAIQGSHEFAYVPFVCNRLEFLVINVFIYGIAMFVIAVIIWGIVSVIFNVSGAGAVVMMIFTIEYLLYKYVPVSSTFGIVKYFNVYQLLFPLESIYSYSNVYFIRYIFGRNIIFIISIIIYIVIGSFMIFLVSQNRRPVKSYSKMDALIKKAVIKYQKAISRLNPYGLDIYKILVSQKGIIVIILLAVLISRVHIYGSVYYDSTRDIMRDYYNQVGGLDANNEINEYINQYKWKLDEKNNELLMLNEMKDKGEVVNGSYIKTLTEEVTALSDAVDEMEQQLNYLLQIGQEHSIDVQVIRPYDYQGIMCGNFDYSLNLIDLYIFIALIFLMSGSIVCERKGSMVQLIRCSVNGRGAFIKRKILVNSIVSILLGFFVYLYFYIKLLTLYNIDNINCSIYSLSNMAGYPFDIRIIDYFIIGFVVKLLIVWVIAMIITMFSLLLNEKFTLISCFILAIPHMLYLLGFDFFKYFSIILPLNDWQLYRMYINPSFIMVTYIILAVIGFACMSVVIKRWTYNHGAA